MWRSPFTRWHLQWHYIISTNTFTDRRDSQQRTPSSSAFTLTRVWCWLSGSFNSLLKRHLWAASFQDYSILWAQWPSYSKLMWVVVWSYWCKICRHHASQSFKGNPSNTHTGKLYWFSWYFLCLIVLCSTQSLLIGCSWLVTISLGSLHYYLFVCRMLLQGLSNRSVNLRRWLSATYDHSTSRKWHYMWCWSCLI